MYNFDGILKYSGYQEGKTYSYVQLYRNGIIEAVNGSLLAPWRGGELRIRTDYEQELINSFKEYLNILTELTVELPIFIFLTLLGVKGYSMAVSRESFSIDETHAIDRDVLVLPEAIIESYDVSAEKVLKPSFDSIWNACGFPRDPYYNDEGEWAPKG